MLESTALMAVAGRHLAAHQAQVAEATERLARQARALLVQPQHVKKHPF